MQDAAISEESAVKKAASLGKAIRDAIRHETTFDPDEFEGVSLPDAYGVQAGVFRALGRSFQGSKLNLKGEVCHSAPLLWVSENDSHAYQDGMSMEVELAFELGRDVTTQNGPLTRADIACSIASVRLGVELVRSRYIGGSRRDPAFAVADMMSNAGYILGPSLDRRLLEETVSFGPLLVTVEGRIAFDRPAVHIDGDPLKSMTVLANQTSPSSFSILKAGQVITTGSLCGMIPVGAPGSIEVGMGGRQFVLDVLPLKSGN